MNKKVISPEGQGSGEQTRRMRVTGSRRARESGSKPAMPRDHSRRLQHQHKPIPKTDRAAQVILQDEQGLATERTERTKKRRTSRGM